MKPSPRRAAAARRALALALLAGATLPHALRAQTPEPSADLVIPDEEEVRAARKDPTFAVPEEMASRVRFWKDVYSKYSTGTIVVHDTENFDVVYAVLDETELLKGASSRSERAALIEKEKDRINAILVKLADGRVRPSDLTEEDLAIYAQVRKFKGWRGFAGRLRSQEGLADDFKRGVEASGAYWREIERIFEDEGLPKELARLCFVESLFRFDAYSKVGATGLWQFMRSTGKLYLAVNDLVDERLDPLASTRAAARLLKDNYRILGSWPVAVTAYNHGRGGMVRAAAQTGSSDIVRIINEYQSPSFKFASKNFYASFLAAKEILEDPERYFPDLSYAPPLRLASLELPSAMYLRDLARFAGLAREDLAAYNPAWLRPITTDQATVPAGATVRLPAERLEDFRAALAANAPTSAAYVRALPRFESGLDGGAPAAPAAPPASAPASAGEPFRQRVVGSGDTLGSIARASGVSVAALREANSLGPADLLVPGRTLRIPEPPAATPTAVADPAPPAPARAPAPAAPRSERSLASVERARKAKEPERFLLHRVMKGETLQKIARSYRVRPDDIRDANGISDEDVKPGKFLKIPTR